MPGSRCTCKHKRGWEVLRKRGVRNKQVSLSLSRTVIPDTLKRCVEIIKHKQNTVSQVCVNIPRGRCLKTGLFNIKTMAERRQNFVALCAWIVLHTYWHTHKHMHVHSDVPIILWNRWKSPQCNTSITIRLRLHCLRASHCMEVVVRQISNCFVSEDINRPFFFFEKLCISWKSLLCFLGSSLSRCVEHVEFSGSSYSWSRSQFLNWG